MYRMTKQGKESALSSIIFPVTPWILAQTSDKNNGFNTLREALQLHTYGFFY